MKTTHIAVGLLLASCKADAPVSASQAASIPTTASEAERKTVKETVEACLHWFGEGDEEDSGRQKEVLASIKTSCEAALRVTKELDARFATDPYLGAMIVDLLSFANSGYEGAVGKQYFPKSATPRLCQNAKSYYATKHDSKLHAYAPDEQEYYKEFCGF